ncbi:hypothetical protein scyTo_0023233 [Scyliorhinus torazame]|uniref:Uncharacterized protein n=1 Tax=Scyliorhinus torazame TaxID=75743 RepID=A0A401Q5W9_SCYTO|nr:hypothetical protein [Scyliorhinus torazame]
MRKISVRRPRCTSIETNTPATGNGKKDRITEGQRNGKLDTPTSNLQKVLIQNLRQLQNILAPDQQRAAGDQG